MRAFLPILLLAAAPLDARPVPADIPLVAIGLPYAPETPVPVSPKHPLYHRVSVSEIAELPSALRWSVARLSTINKGLRDTLERMNMLAPEDAQAGFRLVAHWGDIQPAGVFSGPGIATASLRYELTRIDTGQMLFNRNIATRIDGSKSGPYGAMNTRRAAVAVNFASAAACLDKAAYGRAPADCALSPKFSVVSTRY